MLADLNLTILKIFTILQIEDSYCRGRIDLRFNLPCEGVYSGKAKKLLSQFFLTLCYLSPVAYRATLLILQDLIQGGQVL